MDGRSIAERSVCLGVRINHEFVFSETKCTWLSRRTFGVDTKVGSDLTVELCSTFLATEHSPTFATHTVISPARYQPKVFGAEHDRANLDPFHQPDMCLHEHAHVLLEILTHMGYWASSDANSYPFDALKDVEL